MSYKILNVLFVVFYFSCSNVDPNQDPNPSYGTDGRYGSFVQDTVYALADTVIRGKFLNTSLAPKLSLGEYDGLSSGFEITFLNLPDDSVEIDSAYLKFTALNSFGPNANQVTSASMYRIIQEWKVDSINIEEVWRNPTDNSFVTEISVVNFKLQDSSETFVSLPLNILSDWKKDTTTNKTNFGLYFHPLEEDVVVELGSRSSSFSPMLIYYSHIEDSVIIDTLLASRDATIFNYDDINGSALSLDQNKILVSSGIVSFAFLKFDISGLPDNAIFYSANLILTEDDSNPYENPDNSTTFILRPLEKLTSNQDDFVFSPNRVYSLSSKDGFTKVSGTNKDALSTGVIQEIQNGVVDNEGFLIEFSINNVELSVKRFWGAKADKSVSPKLVVKYLNAKK